MTLKELQSQVSYLGFETELTDTEAFILAAERALRQIYLDHPSVATAVIPTPMPRLITAFDRILHRAGEEEVIPLSGRALTFRVSGVGKYCIREGNQSYEVPFSGRSVTVRRTLREGAELILRGEYDFTVYDIGLKPHTALTAFNEIIVGLILFRQRFLLTSQIYKQLITVEPIIKTGKLLYNLILYFFYISHYFSLYITVKTVCPTAFSVALSIHCISSFIV